jgi:hypothetical protein
MITPVITKEKPMIMRQINQNFITAPVATQ